jgi:hypothetical protein
MVVNIPKKAKLYLKENIKKENNGMELKKFLMNWRMKMDK